MGASPAPPPPAQRRSNPSSASRSAVTPMPPAWTRCPPMSSSQHSTKGPSLDQPSVPPRERALEQFAMRIRDRPMLSRLDAAAVEAFNALDAADVDALLLKGPALARALY